MGVVTNKPGWLTHRLLDALDLWTRARCIVSGDTTIHRKPHPAPLPHAADLLSVKAAQCAFAGDARDDIVAGHKAGMKRWLPVSDISTPAMIPPLGTPTAKRMRPPTSCIGYGLGPREVDCADHCRERVAGTGLNYHYSTVFLPAERQRLLHEYSPSKRN